MIVHTVIVARLGADGRLVPLELIVSASPPHTLAGEAGGAPLSFLGVYQREVAYPELPGEVRAAVGARESMWHFAGIWLLEHHRHRWLVPLLSPMMHATMTPMLLARHLWDKLDRGPCVLPDMIGFFPGPAAPQFGMAPFEGWRLHLKHSDGSTQSWTWSDIAATVSQGEALGVVLGRCDIHVPWEPHEYGCGVPDCTTCAFEESQMSPEELALLEEDEVDLLAGEDLAEPDEDGLERTKTGHVIQ